MKGLKSVTLKPSDWTGLPSMVPEEAVGRESVTEAMAMGESRQVKV